MTKRLNAITIGATESTATTFEVGDVSSDGNLMIPVVPSVELLAGCTYEIRIVNGKLVEITLVRDDERNAGK